MDARLTKINEWWASLPEGHKWQCYHLAVWGVACLRRWRYVLFIGEPIIIGG